MKEIAFVVEKNTEFYRAYFASKQEQQLFKEKARAFFLKYNIKIDKYILSERMTVKFKTDEEKNKYENQILKQYDKEGYATFKKSSRMQKLWEQEVTSNICFTTLNRNQFWYFEYFSSHSFSYSLWDYKGNVYGYFCAKDRAFLPMPPFAKEIKMSEYYRIIEESEEQ